MSSLRARGAANGAGSRVTLETAVTARIDSTRSRNRVRIIGGRWRGRRIDIVTGTAVRPTPGRVRETLFNWLAETVSGSTCLDLFAGTGVLGLEALSRGAAEVTFVEHDRRLAQSLRSQLAALGSTARVVDDDAMSFLSRTEKREFDIVFLDPPYAAALEPILATVRGWLAHEATVYVERPRSARDLRELLAAIPGAYILKEASAGDVAYGLLRYEHP